MKKAITASLLTLGLAAAAHADVGAGAKHFNASFWAPDHQLVSASEDIKGLRLNFFYGKNKNVTGCDIGTANSVTGDMNGAQLSVFLPCVYNHVAGKLNGAQFGIVNHTGKEVNGVSWGLVNYNTVADSELSGVDLGFVNYTPKTDVYGVQLGFVNFCHHLKGVQLGLWNMVMDRQWSDIGNKGLGRGFPFINVGW